MRKYQYQVACRSPQQTKAKDDDADHPASYSGDEVRGNFVKSINVKHFPV